MTTANGDAFLTRTQILQLLNRGELAGASVMETAPRLSRGQEYLDLEQLEQGVQRATGDVVLQGAILSRKSIHEDTWRRILKQLAAAHI